MPAEEPETAAARVVELVTTRIPKRFGFDAVRDIQVLCPMNRGGAGARSLNIELQAALNPAGERKVERFGSSGLSNRSGKRTDCAIVESVTQEPPSCRKRLWSTAF